MNRIAKLLINDDKVNEKSNYLWNMVGGAIYSMISMLLSIVVIRIMGEDEGGIFSIAVTLSQMMLYIAFFELRTYQITDVKCKYEFSQYHAAKIICCMMMIFVSVFYVFANQYEMKKTIIVLLMCIYRMLDGYEDLYDGEFQVRNRLDISGKALGFRSLISSSVFLIVLLFSKNIIFSLIIAITIAIFTLWYFDISVMTHFGSIKPNMSFNVIKNILVDCFPYFIGSFLWVYILSASRIAIDIHMDDKFQTYFQVIFMPVSIINLFSTFIFRPQITEIAKIFSEGKINLFIKKIINICLMISLFTMICMLCGYFLGIPVLNIISNCSLGEYRFELIILLLAGGFNALSFFLYYVLSSMRDKNGVLIIYIFSAIIAFISSYYLVKIYGISGGTYSFLITTVIMSMLFIFRIAIKCKNNISIGS